MEKLIDKCGTPKACWKCQPEPCDQCNTINEVFERLKKYEDTDRIPEEIPALIAEVERLTAENQGLRANSMIQEHIIAGARDPIKDGEITRLIMDNAAKYQQTAWLKKALELMAKYIVELGRVDDFLCDNIPQSLHLKYQPKNDGNYENKPCIECVQEYFIQQAQGWEGKK